MSAYRPPSNDITYAESLCNAIRKIAKENPTAAIWLSGDLNLPDIDWESMSIVGHRYTIAINKCFISMLDDLGLTKIVDFPTRDDNILDIFATNRPALVSKCIPLPGVSDHEIVLTISDIRAKRMKPVRRKILLWKKVDFNDLKSEINKFSDQFCSTTTLNNNINDMWNQITSFLHHLMDTMVPSKLSSSRFSQPWINRHLKALSRRKKKAFKRAKRTKNPSDWLKYKNLKKIMQRDSRNAYHSFISDMLASDSDSDSSFNRKKFWSYIKSKRCDSSGVAPLMKDGSLQSDCSTKANILNEQFVSVFTNEDVTNLPDLGESDHPSVPSFVIEREGVRKLLAKIKPHTACGPDNLPAYLLKEASNELAPLFCLLFNATLHQGKIPHAWKSANVSPIFKKGDKHRPENYRPISLTSLVCKTAEHIIHSQIIHHLDANNILTHCQFGFRKKRSCDSQLLLTVDDLARGLRDRQQIDAILLDFSKAFDKVPHRRLILKLHHYGIRGQLLSWIEDFLSLRSQCVILEGKESSTASVTSGVPQGTVLGPLLFLVFINDMPDCVSSNIRLFADDALLYRTITSCSKLRATDI